MKPKNILRNIFKKKAFEPTENLDLSKIGWHTMGGSMTYAHFKSNDYENAYPSITKIANAVAVTEQYTIDSDGNSVPSNVLDVTYSPNSEMSAVDFREALAIMTCVHNKVFIKVHYSGERITEQSITGFTFLEGAIEIIKDGVRYLHLNDGTKLEADKYITLKSINPYALSEGFSPSQSARKWIKLDDYIAMYQQGFFKNGAVPAGQFIITAKTVADYNDIVDRLEEHHKGAGKNNNVVYVHRPTDMSGKPVDAQIEWVPFNQSNKDMSLKDLFEQANMKIDSAFGVPASIRGVNDQNTYASVRVDEVIFAKYVVNPILMKIWNKFTHELNRITGGLGVAFDYDLDIPTVADEEKVKAEARLLDIQAITQLQTAGYSLESIVTALDLDEEYLALETGVVTDTDEPQVMENGESNIIQDDMEKRMTPQARQRYENMLSGVIAEQKRKQVQEAIDELDDKNKVSKPSQADVLSFTNSMYAVIEPVLNIEGSAQRATALNLLVQAGIKDTPSAFKLTTEQLKKYQEYLLKVGNSYTETTTDGIRAVLERGAEQGLTAAEIRGALQDYALSDYEINRLAVTEINRAGSEASVFAMENIADEVGVKIYKVWNANADACEFCAELDGQRTLVEETFVPVGETIFAGDSSFTNNFVDIEDTTLHPHCACYPTYEVER